MINLFKIIFKSSSEKVSKVSISDIRSAVIEAKEILNKIKVRHWITDGTLLGYFREGDIIGHDIDADLGCLIEDYTDEIIPNFLKNGWSLVSVHGEKKCGLELSFSKTNARVDIFFFYKEEGRLWHGAWAYDGTKGNFNLIKYIYDDFDLKCVNFLGTEFMAPADTLKYVTTKYGSSWDKPQKKWDWAFDPENSIQTDVYMKFNKHKKVI